MTRLEVITLIGDFITEVDVARGSLLPNDPSRQKLDDLRLLLDDRQRRLSQKLFDENSTTFQNAAQQLQDLNGQIKASIRHVEQIVTVLTNVERFLNAVTSIVTTVGAFL